MLVQCYNILMEKIFADIHWIAVLLSTLAVFMVGWAWYSEKVFGKWWRAGIGAPAVSKEVFAGVHMVYGMLAQFFATALLAVIVSIMIISNLLWVLLLVALMLAGFVKANGFYAGKTKTAISIEVSYMLAMVILLYFIQTIFY